MKNTRIIFFFLLLCNFCSATIRNVPANYNTVQSALSACQVNDTILVQPGTYFENLTWPAINGIKLLSVAGADSTIISAGGINRVLSITNSIIDTTSRISGFTFRDGNITTGSGYGAGIYITDASIIIENCRILNNRVFVPGGHGYGAGIYISDSFTRVSNCTISGNRIDTATWCYGAGIFISGGEPVINDVVISNNKSNAEIWCYGVGLYARANAIVTLKQLHVTGNYSGDNASYYYGNGIYLGNVTASLENVLITLNRSGINGNFNYGGGIFCDGNAGVMILRHVTIADNFKTGNATITGSGIYVRDANVTVSNSILYNSNPGNEASISTNGLLNIAYSNVRGGFAGSNNISSPPGFTAANDYHLLASSPCTGIGTAVNLIPADLDGNPRPLPVATLPDMGCYEIDQSATGISADILTNTTIYVYPNPVISGNNIIISNNIGKIKITDIDGKIVYRDDTNDHNSISTLGWNAGIYFIHTSGKATNKFFVIE